ncbi:MAG: sigma-70 family RNA polymerase sigma factor [Thermoguttaceae bacterium]|jgi:RNA polymerase sigma-70 factor (ECF subfamily)
MPAGGPSETEILIASARGGDGKALGRLLQSYRNYLTLLVHAGIGSRLQSKIDPADVVQETFLRALARFETFRGQNEAELLAWLRKILASQLHNVWCRYFTASCRNVAQEVQLQRELDNSSQLAEALMAPGSSPSQRASHREWAVHVSDRLAELPEHYRQVIMLHHFWELTLPEVAQQMGRSIGSVEKIWVRGLASLRRSLGGSDA